MNKMVNRITLVSLVAAATMSIASAQGSQGGPPQGGPQGGFPGGPGGPGRGPMGGAMILMFPPVREELKLTDEQIEKLQSSLQNQMPRPQQGERPNREAMEKAMEKADATIKSVLSKAQYKRYQEISLQMGGPGAIARPAIAKQLGLSDAQVSSIEKILEANRPQRPDGEGPQGPPPGGDPGQGGFGGPPPGGGFGGGQRGQGGQRGPGGGPNDEKRKEVEKKVLAVLTEAQKTKWKEMQGAPFQMRRPERN